MIDIPKGMNIRDCPQDVINEFAADFTNPALSVFDLIQKWKRPSGTIYRWGAVELGLHRPKLKADTRINGRELVASISKMVQAIPKVNLPYPVISPLTIPAELIAKMSDLHTGRLTSSFNSDTLIRRLAKFGVELDDYVRMLSSRYRIETLHVFAEGDWVLGEQIGKQVNVEEIERLIYEQIFTLAVPYTSQWLIDRLRVVPRIVVHGVRGNHGGLGRYQSQSANWDTFVYKIDEQRLWNFDRIEFDIEAYHWYKEAVVGDLSFLLCHGDQFPVGGGGPQQGVISKVLRWKESLPFKFDVVSSAHFHSRMYFYAGNTPIYFNGTFLTDDDWVREKLGLDGTCSQTLLLVRGRDIIDEREVKLYDA